MGDQYEPAMSKSPPRFRRIQMAQSRHRATTRRHDRHEMFFQRVHTNAHADGAVPELPLRRYRANTSSTCPGTLTFLKHGFDAAPRR